MGNALDLEIRVIMLPCDNGTIPTPPMNLLGTRSLSDVFNLDLELFVIVDWTWNFEPVLNFSLVTAACCQQTDMHELGRNSIGGYKKAGWRKWKRLSKSFVKKVRGQYWAYI